MRLQSTALRDLATQDVVTVGAGTSLAECATLMRNAHVGCVIVTDGAKQPSPLGILTDRDIVVEAVAARIDPAQITAGEAMSHPLATAHPDDDAIDALARMREAGVRRLPLVDAAGRLAGLVTVDDLLAAMSEQFDSVVRVIKTEQAREHATRK